MSSKYLIPALLVSLLAGTASAAPASTDPVRARVLAELEQAKQSGNYPPSEADYVYPNWVKIANPAGVVMTDGHPELENRAGAPAARTAAVAKPAAAKPAVALMTDASQGSVKGGDTAQ
ncbi:DUF4148 domain-containing protein [Massilia sp. Mn16-1_5]|uniref:DUF4148 domain-containing protein n=1 Tax=Massilia sp. Mn16-1_5 TaxID=2079199 RepID=UPI00109E851E|nr:DUF4148 domain-containing protein [Massilia sp. Mn16-1_5]THC46298.1 hypothetical protein C2862_03565 [Massilia sp. Mn16-1_5]